MIQRTFGALALIAAVGVGGTSVSADTTVDIKTWDNTYLYDGWSANDLLGEEVYGQAGESVGEVEDFIVGPDGMIKKVVVEGGGFFDIGDSHVAVPWNEVRRAGTSSITVPVTEGNLDNFGLFDNVDDVPPKPSNFRLSEMIGDSATADGVGYGRVEDVIFNNQGKIEAVIVEPAYGYGYGVHSVAVPYDAGVYDPYSPYYTMPYAVEELAEIRPFNYSRFD